MIVNRVSFLRVFYLQLMSINLGKSHLQQHNITEGDIKINIDHNDKNHSQSYVCLPHPLRSTDQPNKIIQSEIKRVKQHPDVQMLSQNGLSHKTKSYNRVSLALHSAMQKSGLTSSRRKESKEEENKIEPPLKRSRFGRIVRSKINTFLNVKNCDICQEEIKKTDKMIFMCECDHKFAFCKSCLHHYAIYKIKVFEQVACPRDGCNVLIDIEGLFFKQLPIDIQKSYRKIHIFYETTKDPNKKLCPKQNCEGIIQTVAEGQMVCSNCESMFCCKCLLDMHEGLCDQHEVDFFQNNLHYRQCKQCKVVIEKNQGCNHMTCRCSYQFCYICGADWQAAHYGNHDQNGNLVVVVQDERRDQLSVSICTWCCYMLIHPCQFFCKCVAFIPYILLSVFYIVYFILILSLVMVGTIIMGLTGFFIQFVTSLRGIWLILGIIFLPVCMLAGIAIALKLIYWECSGFQYRQLCENMNWCSQQISRVCQL